MASSVTISNILIQKTSELEIKIIEAKDVLIKIDIFLFIQIKKCTEAITSSLT